MVLKKPWTRSSLDAFKDLKIEHGSYLLMQTQIASSCYAMLAGELVVVVGPSRVGKTRCVRDALAISSENHPNGGGHMRVVIVEAGNDSTSGEFSTKGFIIDCLRAIHQPVYGVVAEDDPWGKRLDDLLHRTSEKTLRSAFERALKLRKVEYLVIDEAHHVNYVPGGAAAAARVLDSWKCLANRTEVRLVLVGSYALLSILTLAPHLLGRQQPLEFPRYRSDSRADVEYWEQILRKFSELFQFPDGKSLSQWNRLLFEGSLGRVGGLSLWLRTCLAKMDAKRIDHLSLEVLETCRLPAVQEEAVLAEILDGEQNLLRYQQSAHTGAVPSEKTAVSTNGAKERVKGRPRAKPFQRRPKRHKADGRA